MPPALIVPNQLLDLEDRESGRRLRADDLGSGVQIIVGKVGVRDGRPVRSRLRGWRVGRVGEHVEILATEPVRELFTTRIGEFVAQLTDDVERAGGQDDDLEVLRAAVARVLEVEREPGTLSSMLIGGAFPLLRPALDAGRDLNDVPDVLVPLVRAEDVRSGTNALFGRVTRPLIRAAARRLHPDGGPVFPPLVLAAMAAGTCGPERLTEIIEADVVEPSALTFTLPDVVRARAMFAGVPPRRVSETLIGVLGDSTVRHVFADQIAAWHPPLPEPRPRPEPQVAAEAQPPSAGAQRHQRVAPLPETPRPLALMGRPREIIYPPVWQAAEGAHIAGYVIALPRDADDLRHWGIVLGNCLGAFGDAAAAGASRLVGLVRTRQLRYVVEVTPGGVIRQLEGAGNRRPNRALGNEIARQIIALGLATADGRTGQSLVAPRPR